MTTSRSMTTAMLCAATVTAQFVAAKATRDALFLTSLGAAALPTMLIATSACSILLVLAHARLAGKVAPARLVPASFCASGILFLAEWIFRAGAPAPTAVALYLHISAVGPLLASGFWLIVSERFNPRTAKKGFGRLAGAGTLGGLLGALLAERVGTLAGVPCMLLILAALQFLAAGLVRILALSAATRHPAPAGAVAAEAPASARSGLRVLARSPRLRHLMALVLLGTTSAALLDYVFKVRAAETFGFGDTLLRFFALYYAGTNVVAFLLQVTASRAVLERFGLTLATSSPSIALLAGCAGALAAPGFGSIFVARGAESIFRGSWFRAGYELFYTPIPAAEKRTAKSFIDVAFDRLGEAVGGGVVRLAVLLVPAAQASVILGAAMVGSIGAILAASHLNRWYLRALESSLLDRAGGMDLSDTGDGSTTRVLLSVQRGRPDATDAKTVVTAATVLVPAISQEAQDVLTLQSGSRDEVIKVLFRDDRLPMGLVAHVIPMLARDTLADFAAFALKKIAEERVGQLTDALLDPNQDYAVRRQLARVFSVCVSQRATDALLLALDDPRFDVRFQAARSLAAIVDKNPRVHIHPSRIYDVVLREAAAGRPMWEGRRLLDGLAGESPLDAFVRGRASDSLAHVFTLLALVLPREPLQIAFRSLRAGDEHLRGTALEYLEGVLPPPIRQRLWPFLVKQPTGQPAGSYDEVMAHLLRSSQSVTLRDLAGGASRSAIAAC